MKREAQATRNGQDLKRRKHQNLGESGPGDGGVLSSFRDCQSIFNRIVKGKQPISDFELTSLNTTWSYILAVIK